MKLYRLLSGFVLLALVMSIAPISIAEEAETGTTGTVNVIVTDMETGDPIEGAIAYIYPVWDYYGFDDWMYGGFLEGMGESSVDPGMVKEEYSDMDESDYKDYYSERTYQEYRDITDANGTCSFEVEAGSYEINVYEDWYYDYYTSFEITKDASITLEIPLEKVPEPPCTVSGYVYEEGTNTTISGAYVHVEPLGPPEPWFEICWDMDMKDCGFLYPMYAKSDENGYYEIKLDPGTYNIFAKAEGYFKNDDVFKVEEDVPEVMDLYLEAWPEPNSVLQGHVYDFENGLPIPGAVVRAFPAHALDNILDGGIIGSLGSELLAESFMPRYEKNVTDENGFYSIDVCKGLYMIIVKVDNYTCSINHALVPDNMTMTVDFSLKERVIPVPGVFLEGRILDPEGNPIPDAEVNFESADHTFMGGFGQDFSGLLDGISPLLDGFMYDYGDQSYIDMYSEILPLGGGLLSGLGDLSSLGNILGSFSTMGEYDLDGTEIIKGLDMDMSEESYGFEIPMGKEMTVYNDMGLLDYMPTNYHYTDDEGNFHAQLFEGSYFVTVWAEGYRTYYDEVFLEDGDQYFEFVLEPMPEPDAVIRGKVIEANTEKPVPGAEVNVFLQERRMMSNGWWDEGEWDYFFNTVWTGRDGTFEIPVPAGSYGIEVYGYEYESYFSEVYVDHGDEVNVRVLLKKATYGIGLDDGWMNGQAETGRNYDTANSAPERIQKREGGNRAPQAKKVDKTLINNGQMFFINIGELFLDMDNDSLSFTFDKPDKLGILYDPNNEQFVIEAPEDWTGEEEITVYASDGSTMVENTIPVEVGPLDSTTSTNSRSSDGGMFQTAMLYIAGIMVALLVIYAIFKNQGE